MASYTPRSLEPNQIALPVELARGALVALPDPRAADRSTYEVLRFQYNPETVTRARTGQWERKLDKKNPTALEKKNALDAARGGSLKAKSEIISFKLVFDAAELLLSATPPPPITGLQPFMLQGVLPELAVLERLALGPDQIPDPPKDNEFPLVALEPTEAILVLGPRSFPGVITQMNIVEQRFSPSLVPIRAEIDIRFRVLEATAVAVNKDTEKVFKDLLDQRAKLSAQGVDHGVGETVGKAIKEANVSGGVSGAIANLIVSRKAGTA